MLTTLGTLLLLFVLLIALVSLARSARVVAQYEKGLVMRLGRYRATADSGLTFLVPVIEDMIKVDMRERVINVEPQKVITKDNVSVTVDAVIYYRISDPVKATFEVQNFGYAATTLAQTNLRNLIGDKSLDETLTARDTINANLRTVLDEATSSRPRSSSRRACASRIFCGRRVTPRRGSRVPPRRPRRSRWSPTRPSSSSRSARRSASGSTCSTRCSPTRPSSSCPPAPSW